LKKDSVVCCSKEFLWKKIRETGFKWKKCQLNRRLLVEKMRIAAWKGTFTFSCAYHFYLCVVGRRYIMKVWVPCMGFLLNMVKPSNETYKEQGVLCFF
jgi:hypothetical protein